MIECLSISSVSIHNQEMVKDKIWWINYLQNTPLIYFEATLSRGPGGQHVNRTASAVLLKFDWQNCPEILPHDKEIISQKLINYLNAQNWLQIRQDAMRSQWQNKQEAIKKLASLICEALKKNKKRIPTKATFSSVKKRLSSKRQMSLNKSLRKKVTSSDA